MLLDQKAMNVKVFWEKILLFANVVKEKKFVKGKGFKNHSYWNQISIFYNESQQKHLSLWQ